MNTSSFSLINDENEIKFLDYLSKTVDNAVYRKVAMEQYHFIRGMDIKPNQIQMQYIVKQSKNIENQPMDTRKDVLEEMVKEIQNLKMMLREFVNAWNKDDLLHEIEAMKINKKIRQRRNEDA